MKNSRSKLKDRPYNSGTMTESMFFGMLRSCLRSKSRFWKPRLEVLKDSRRKFVGGGRQKWEYRCCMCGGWFKNDDVEVNHKVEAGSLRSFDDLGGFAQRLFCEKEGLEVVCKACHLKKHNHEKEN